MPTPVKTTENIRKHLSKAERQARERAEGELRRGKRPSLPVPDWLSDEAKKIFETTKRRMRSSNVLESADVDLLALYCDAVASYQEAKKTLDTSDSKAVTAIQSWSRLALTYGEKLGVSATGRARLAKKKAENAPLDEYEQMLDDVTDFVNGDVQ